MSFAIIRIHKHKTLAAVAGVARHHSREIECPTADAKRSPNNVRMGLAKGSSKDLSQGIKGIIDNAQAKAKRKFRSDSVKVVEFMITASPEFFASASKKQKVEFFKKSQAFLEKKYGKDNIVATWIHLDETTPHLHVLLTPFDAKGVLNARSFFGTAEKLSQLQTDFAAEVASLGLERGLKGSTAKHQPCKAFWNRIFSETPSPAPSKSDYLKAAMGLKVESIEKLQEKAESFTLLKKATSNIFQKSLGFSRKQREIEEDLNALRVKQDMFAKRSFDFETLMKENQALKKQIAILNPKSFTPGQSLERLGL